MARPVLNAGSEAIGSRAGECEAEERLRERAVAERAAAARRPRGVVRPHAFEQDGLLACAAPSRSGLRAHLRLCSRRPQPAPILRRADLPLAARTHAVASRGAGSLAPRTLAPGRRLQAAGEERAELRQELRLAPGLFESLIGAPLDPASLSATGRRSSYRRSCRCRQACAGKRSSVWPQRWSRGR